MVLPSSQQTEVVCLASWNADLVSHMARPPARGETVLAHGFEVSPGGKGSNAAVACARQGARVALLARIGADDFGRMALALWTREGIDASRVERVDGEPSGVAQIFVFDDGDNAIAVASGANAGLGARHVEAAAATIREARIVMASCEVPLAATQAAFAIARAAGVTTLLNPAPALPLPDALIALTDVLTPNEAELHALAESPTGSSVDSAAQALLARGARAVVVTLGAAGCRLYRGGAAPHAVAGLRAGNVIDTIGAGDTFSGALGAALARGEALEAAVRWANAAAALSVTGRGALGGMPDRALVERLLALR
jgi:ribokinase